MLLSLVKNTAIKMNKSDVYELVVITYLKIRCKFKVLFNLFKVETVVMYIAVHFVYSLTNWERGEGGPQKFLLFHVSLLHVSNLILA